MKITMQSQIVIALAALFAVATTFTSCKKSPEEIAALLSESEAAEIVETAVAEKLGGITVPTVDMAAMLESLLTSCGQPGDTSYTKSKTTGLATYDYTWNLDWLVNCNDFDIPQDATFDIAATGTFASQRWSGDDTTTGQMTFTGLQPSATEYTANGSYLLEGVLTGALRKTSPSLDVSLDMDLADLKLSKTSNQITNGDGTFTLEAKAKNAAESITLTGSIAFNGDGTVTVKVNGHEHTFDLQ